MDRWSTEPSMPMMDNDVDTTESGSSIGSRGSPRWSEAPIFRATTQHSLADVALDAMARIKVHDPIVEIPQRTEAQYIIQPMYSTRGKAAPLRSTLEAQKWPNLLDQYPTNLRPADDSGSSPKRGVAATPRFRNVDEMPKPNVPILPAPPTGFELRWAQPASGSSYQPADVKKTPTQEDNVEDTESEDHRPAARPPEDVKSRPQREASANPFREKDGRYPARTVTVRFADYERRIMKENQSFAARKALLAQTHQGLKIEPIGGNVARVTMCGFMKPGDPTMTCGIYTTKTYDLIRHRVAHLYYECLVAELDEIPPGGGLVFGGFHVELPTCPSCGKSFTRWDSLQRHGKRTDTACFAPNRAKHTEERADPEKREENLRRELEKNIGMQYWIKTPQPLPKTVRAKVGLRNGGPGLGSCVLEILSVLETYAAKYEFTTVKEGKELQVRLLDHGEPGGIPFYRPMKGSYDPNPSGNGLVLP